MALLFVPCVLLQYNDPDPIRWMLLYGTAAVITVGLALAVGAGPTRRFAVAGVLVGLVAAVWCLYLVPGIWGKVTLGDALRKMSEKGGAVEQEREVGGLAITALWLMIASGYRGRSIST